MNELHFYSYDCIWNPWLGGGGGVRDLEMLHQYSRYFSKITLFVGSYPHAKDTVWQNTIHIRHLGPSSPSNEVISRIYYIIQANKQIKVLSPHVIGFGVSPYSPLFNLLNGARNNVPRFGVLHHYLGKHSIKKRPLVGIFPYLFEKWYYKRIQNLVILNPKTLSFLKSLGHTGNYYLSQNSYSPSLLQVLDQQNLSEPYILYFGRLEPYMKGLDLLVEAFASLYASCQTSKKWKLILAGRADTKLTQTLENLLAQHPTAPIKVIHNPSDSQKEQLLSQCSFFCSPSRFEGWGIAALEANAAGKPCLVSNISGFQSSIGNNVSGELVPIQSAKDLERALQRWIENPDYVNQLKSGARKWAKQFSWENIARKELEWIKTKVLNSSRSTS